MRVFIGVASSQQQLVGSLVSCYEIRRRQGDDFTIQYKTRGDIARETLVDHLLAHPEYDAILLLDGDQRHPEDLLEKLRESMETLDLDMVCAHYYRRETRVIHSLCYEYGDGTYPFMPMLEPPRTGLHRIAWAGFGCVLIHRRVLEAVRRTLPDGENPVATGPLPEVSGSHQTFGPDARFFLRAMRLGYKLYLRADVESLHGVTMWLGHKGAAMLRDYRKWADSTQQIIEERLRLHGMTPEAFRQRLRLLEARKQGALAELDKALAGEDQGAVQELTVALHILDGKMGENQAWLEALAKHPPIRTEADLPTTENTPAHQTFADENDAGRKASYQYRANELVALLPEAEPPVNHNWGHGRDE